MTSPGMYICVAGCPGGDDRLSEDKIARAPGAVFVLDGESHVYDPTMLVGGWYANDLGDAVAEKAAAAPDADLRQLLEEAIGELAVVHGLTKKSPVAVSVSMVRQREQHVEALVLGDCTVVAVAKDRTVEVVRDDRPARVITACPELEAYQKRLQAGHGFDAEHRDLLARLNDSQRRHLNCPDGYWMAQALPEAARHAVVRSWPVADLAEVLIMTDGVSVAVEKYRLMSWTDMARLCRTHGPALVLDRIRQAELADPLGLRWPRKQQSDDKSLATMTLPAAE
ncbi:protein phosphatase 2C domain-containing protein [Streptomyces botrytidirepellens]|uniref:PPM-type phosphatase domain-containing protein n=1 Tax=Streptomyces botrytidirepellens TaxID=2486417 RepID=A0A3M8X8V1_9ACTN|nr:protein phosphatase 2C domain-containing protein [Streptomyces botrytidirepellens]RNG37381.1 hypothetical protein EEJ42_02380 [Streptomyces botrytidirepellens]